MGRKQSPTTAPPTSESEAEADEKNETNENDFDYDPNQDPDLKRDIRRNIRGNMDRVNELKSNIKNVKLAEMREGLEREDREFSRVRDTTEALLDSRVLRITSEIAAAKAKAMRSDVGGFDVDDFVSKLVTFMGGRRHGLQQRDDSEGFEGDDDDDDSSGVLDWSRVGRLALARSRRVPVIDFMLGPLSAEQKQRKNVVRAKYEKNKEPGRAPQQLTEGDVERSQNETTKNVAMIRQLLEEQGEKVNFLKFITNPKDFGQSVENLFYLSFLIREGRCAVEFDEKTLEPLIYTCEEPTEEDFVNGVAKQQVVFEYDMATWQHAIEVFDIKSSIIPHRAEVETTSTDGKILLA